MENDIKLIKKKCGGCGGKQTSKEMNYFIK